MNVPPLPGSGAFDWTPAQRLAVSLQGGNILVSASAGTGKTAVLVERALRLLLDPARPVGVDKLLVVTFTDAAAAEMRGRILAALLERQAAEPMDAHLARQIALLPRARVSTIHSFCLGLVRDNFARLGLDPALRVMDEHEAELLRLDALDQVFEEHYNAADQAFFDLVDRYGSDRGDEPLRQLALDLHAYSRGLPDPAAWLERSAAAFDLPDGAKVRDLPWAGSLAEFVSSEVRLAVAMLRQAIGRCAAPDGPRAYTTRLEEDLACLEGLERRCQAGDLDALARSPEVLDAGSTGRLPQARGVADEARQAVRDLRERAWGIVDGLRRTLLGRDAASLLADVRALHGPMHTLVGLVNELDRGARAARAAAGFLDFDDFEHYALELLRQKPDADAAADAAADAGRGAGAAARAGAAGEPVPTPLARELRQRFVEVLVDEFQDINPVQEMILRLVSSGNLFAIGDVKQSIYRFRGTDPDCFARLLGCYARAEDEVETGPGAPPGGRWIGLHRNYRSRPAILEAVNFVFRQIMGRELAEVAYDETAELKPGFDYSPSPSPDGPVELYVFDRRPARGGDEGEGGAGAEDEDRDAAGDGGGDGPPDEDEAGLDDLGREALLVGRRILRMVGLDPAARAGGPEFSVYDKHLRRYRPVAFRDVAVLMRAVRGRANRFMEVLSGLGIPVRADLSSGYFTAIEVETMLALLQVIDNPRQDIPLAAVLRSPIVGLDERELAATRLALPRGEFYEALLAAAGGGAAEGAVAERLRRFLGRLDGWRTAARRGPLGDLVWRLLHETDYLAFVGGLPAGPQRQANLAALHERAREFDRFARQGLSRFLRFIQRLHEAKSDLGAVSDPGEGLDCVLLTSVHKSKGLEFPVVFLPDLGRALGGRRTRREVLWHRQLGLGPLLRDRERGISYPTLAWHALEHRIAREELAEEMRVLYVAMTRARERLVLSGSTRGLGSRCAAWAGTVREPGILLPEVGVSTAPTYLDWIARAVARHRGGRALRGGAPDGPRDGAAGASSGTPADGCCAALWQDPSRWTVTLLAPDVDVEAAVASVASASAPEPLGGAPAQADAAPAGSLPGQKTPAPAGGAWERIAAAVAGLRPAVEVPAALELELERRVAWRYPGAARSFLPSKATVTGLVRGEGAPRRGQGEEEPGVELGGAGRRALGLPSLRDWGAARGLDPADRGALTHLAIRRLELGGRLDREGLGLQVRGMERAGLLPPGAGEDVDLDALAWFFCAPAGRFLVARRAGARREVPFTLALPAAEAWPELAAGLDPDGAALRDEDVLVQGMVDCLVREGDCWTLMDFKTDRLEPRAVSAASARYRPQLELYARAVRESYGQPVVRGVIVFLGPRAVEALWGPVIGA